MGAGPHNHQTPMLTATRMSAMSNAFFRSKSILITGASSGIGEELALQLAAAGAHLTLTARRRELLDTLAQRISTAGHETPLVVSSDVTRDGDPENAVNEAIRSYGNLDIVIANAGFGVVGPFSRLTIDDYRRQFETNVFGLLRTLYAGLSEIQKSRGHLVLIGSVAGWGSTPGASAYAMSKFAVRALANAITPELALDGVTVTLISPGFVASDIRRVNNSGTLQSPAREPIPAWLVMPAPKAVRQILSAVARGKREAVITGHGKVLVFIERFAPWILRAAGRRLAATRGGYRTEPGS